MASPRVTTRELTLLDDGRAAGEAAAHRALAGVDAGLRAVEQLAQLGFEVDDEVLVLEDSGVSGFQGQDRHKGSFLGRLWAADVGI